jgi:hypothetical protein
VFASIETQTADYRLCLSGRGDFMISVGPDVRTGKSGMNIQKKPAGFFLPVQQN